MTLKADRYKPNEYGGYPPWSTLPAVNVFTGIESARIEASEFHPLPRTKVGRQQQECSHKRDGAGFCNTLDAGEQQELTFEPGMLLPGQLASCRTALGVSYEVQAWR